MMINKNRFRVSNDKKVLHKIGKRWVTVSALTLALLGGGALAGSVTTHAASTQPQAAQTTKQPSATPKGIMKTASALHANVLANAQKPASSASAKSSVASRSASSASSKASSSNAAMNTLNLGTKSEQARGWNFVQNGVRNDDYDNTKPSAVSSSSSATQSASSSASASSVAPSGSVSASAKPSFNSAYMSYEAQMSSTDSEVASANAGNVQSDKKNIQKPVLKDTNSDDNYFFGGGVSYTGVDDGLNYTVYNNSGIEFTDGTSSDTLSNFYENSGMINAKAVKFDSGINMNNANDINNMLYDLLNVQYIDFGNNFSTNNVTRMDSMFEDDTNLKELNLSNNFNTSNVTDMSDMFTGDNNLKLINIQSPSTILSSTVGLPTTKWYKQIPGTPYTTGDAVNLMDGKSHVGTWLRTPNPAPEAAPYGVVYLNQNKVEVGQATLSNLGYVGQTVNVEPQLAANVPQGYHLDSTSPINVTLNDGGIINVDTSNGVGANYHGMLGGMLKDSPANTDNHVITVSGNPINYNGNVTLNFKANGKTVKSITKPYSVNTYTGDTVNLLNPASYLDGSNLTDDNNNPITINNTYFTPDGSNNVENVTVTPSDAPQTNGNTKTNNSYVLNYNANSVNDNITYDLSGSNVPSNYQGQTGRLNGTSLNGVYDTNVPLSALNIDVPTNYHIVSGNNIRYDNGSHTVELAPNSENVNVTYTDQNGKTYVGSVNGQYDQKINDITNNYNLPAGYHVNTGQDSSYTFNGNQNQSKALNIIGNTQNGDVTVISKKYDGSTYEGETTKTVPESGKTGNGFTINPTDKQFTPDGYSSQSSQYNGTFTPTGLSTNTVTFNYKAGAGTAISVTYNNQHGANVGSGTITGNTDDRGNINSQVPVPNGYTVNAGQPSQYHILAGAQNPITIKVTGKPVSELNGQGKFTITINKHIGSKVVPSTKTINVSGEVGDTFTVTPSNYTPTGYTSTTNPIQSSITPSGLAKDSASFDYTANTGDPITVTYKNQNGATVGHGSYTGVVDQTGDITSYVKVPSDYTLNGGQNTNFTTTLNDQNMTFNVTGKPANATINFINQNGYPAGAEYVNGKAGDTVSPSSYPKGYEVPAQPTKYKFDTAGQNPAMDNVRLTGKVAGDINGSKAKNAPKTAANGYVTVHVVEKSTSGKVLHKFDTPVSENNKRVGDNYTINPSDTGVQPSNYDVANGDVALKDGVIGTDGSVSKGNVTDTYTVHASDIEPISITFKNQNGHYIDFGDGELTDNENSATYVISDAFLAQLGGVGDSVDITSKIGTPAGYHINGNKENIEDVKGQKLNAITLEHKKVGVGAMPLMLMLRTPAPKPNSSTNKPASSASAKPSSASVAPSSSASVAPSSASVAPSSASSVAPSNASSAASSQSVAPSSAAQSTSTSYVEPSASGNAPQPVSASTSAAPVQTPSDVTLVPSDVTPVKPVTPTVHKHTTTPSEPAKPVTKPSDKIVNKNASGKTETKPATEVSRHAAKVQRAAESHMANVGNMMAQPTVHAADIHASHVNAGSVQHQSTQHKLPQTNEDKAAGLMGASAIMAALGLAGADVDRKRRRE